jgi:hypothetical protein
MKSAELSRPARTYFSPSTLLLLGVAPTTENEVPVIVTVVVLEIAGSVIKPSGSVCSGTKGCIRRCWCDCLNHEARAVGGMLGLDGEIISWTGDGSSTVVGVAARPLEDAGQSAGGKGKKHKV